MWQVDPDSAHRILARIRTCTPPKWSYLPLGYDGPWVHQDYQSSLQASESFDTFLSRLRATVEYVDQGNTQVARRWARVAQTSDNQAEQDVQAFITSTDPMYLNDTILALMRQLDPEFTRKFLKARNKQIASQRTPSTNPIQDKAARPAPTTGVLAQSRDNTPINCVKLTSLIVLTFPILPRRRNWTKTTTPCRS
jgi:hypothetical protein